MYIDGTQSGREVNRHIELICDIIVGSGLHDIPIMCGPKGLPKYTNKQKNLSANSKRTIL